MTFVAHCTSGLFFIADPNLLAVAVMIIIRRNTCFREFLPVFVVKMGLVLITFFKIDLDLTFSHKV